MRRTTVSPGAFFEPSAYRRSIAEMFGLLSRDQQREMAARLAIVPVHIHRLANDGLIAHRTLKRVVRR